MADLYNATEAVVGQESARRRTAVLLARQLDVAEGLEEFSTAALVAGRTGVGKTALLRAMCRACGLPFAEVNAPDYTERGYSGRDLPHMFMPLLESAAHLIDEEHAHAAFRRSAPEGPVLQRRDIDEVIERAQSGVILLDEFDKWMSRRNHVTGERDTAVQAELLKLIEGTEVHLTYDDDAPPVTFATHRVLVICAGAFVGLKGLVGRAVEAEVRDSDLENQVLPEDFVKFGLIPELIGRLTSFIFFRSLGQSAMVRIIKDSGLIEEYVRRFESVGCRLEIEEAALGVMADQARHRETGARGLRNVFDHMLAERLFEAALFPEPCRCLVTAQVAHQPGQLRVESDI